MARYNELDKKVKQSLQGKVGSYFSKLNFRRRDIPKNKFDMYKDILLYLEEQKEFSRIHMHNISWYTASAYTWLNTYEGRVWLSNQCGDWSDKWNKLRNDSGTPITHKAKRGEND